MADTVPETVPQVLTEIQSGDGLSLPAAGRLFPGHRGGTSVDPSTVFRWVTRGARTPSGALVKLEAVRVGVRWLTSRAAVARFVTALTAASGPVPAAAAPAVRRRASASAVAALKAMGA